MNMKQNDWIVATLNNPDFSAGDFKDALGMNLENTQLLSKDEYKSKPGIRAYFTSDNGEFKEDAFDSFYDAQAKKWNNFVEQDTIDNYEFSFWDTNRKPDSKIKDDDLHFINIPNPDRVSLGIAGRNVYGERTKSVSELAQTQKIFDPETGKYIDATPNDAALFKNPFKFFKSLFDEPLVIATYDSAGTHIDPITGMEVAHQKGDYRLNPDGTYFTEKLNGRSLGDKQVISAFDYLTVDDSGINAIDFMDSDGIEKSVGGTIMKTAATIVPLFFGGEVYGGILAAREIMKALPMLYGMAASIVTDDTESEFLNNLAGAATRLSGGTSEYSKQHTVTFENFGNLVSDVATQWGQQRAIVAGINKIKSATNPLKVAQAKALNEYGTKLEGILQKSLTGEMSQAKALEYTGITKFSQEGMQELITSGRWAETPLGKACLEKFLPAAQIQAEKIAKAGQSLSLAYMSIISNTDVYQSALDHGATKQEAAALTLGSMISMYGVDKYLGLGEMFFDDAATSAAQARAGYRKLLSEEAVKAVDETVGAVRDAAPKFLTKTEAAAAEQKLLKRWLSKGLEIGEKTSSNFIQGVKDHTLGFVGKSVGEGLEEVGEELVTDINKQLFELAGKYGYVSVDDFGAWENAKERYLMSFAGGAIGGGIFYGVDAVKNPKTLEQKQSQNSLLYHIANNKTKEILDELETLHKKGKLGSTDLSIDTTTDTEGNTTFISADTKHKSQNDYIYETLRQSILSMESVLKQEGLNLSEDALFENMVQNEARFLELRDVLQDTSYITGYQRKFRDLTKQIFDIDSKIKAAALTINGTVDGPAVPNDSYKRNPVEQKEYDANIKALEQKRTELLAERNNYLNGEYAAYHTEMMLWAMDTGLSGPFIAMNESQFARQLYNRSLDELTEAEKENLRTKFDAYKKSGRFETDAQTAFAKFKEIQERLSPVVQALSDADAKTWQDTIEQLKKTSLVAQTKDYDFRLPGESDDSYKNRRTKQNNESEDEFQARQQARKAQIDQYNEDNFFTYLDKFLTQNPFIDTNTRRQLAAMLNVRGKELVQSLSQIGDVTIKTKDGEELIVNGLSGKLSTILGELKPNLSNKNAIRKKALDASKEAIREFILSNGAPIETFHQNLVQEVKGSIEDSTGQAINLITKQDIYDALNEVYAKLGLKDAESLSDLGVYSRNKAQLEDWLKAETYSEFVPGYYGLGFDTGDDTSFLNDWVSYREKLSKLNFLSGIDDAVITAEQKAEREALQEEIENLNYENIIASASAEEILNTRVEAEFANLENGLNKIIDDVENRISSDSAIKSWAKLDAKTKTGLNPSIALIKAIAPSLGPGFTNIEDALQKIHQNYESEDRAEDFTLTVEEIQALDKADQLLEYAKSFVYAAGTQKRGTMNDPVGHNAVVNDFIKKHGPKNSKTELLVEMDDAKSNMYIYDLTRYQQEIKAWKAKSMANRANKSKKLMDTNEAVIKAKIEFWKNNKTAFKTKSGVDLLNGISFAEASTEADLMNIQNQYYLNVNKALETESFEDVFAFLPKVVKIDKAIRQTPSQIDDMFEYSGKNLEHNMTDYHKFVTIFSAAAISTTEFLSFVKDNITDESKLAPLATQEEAYLAIAAQKSNPEFINQALEYLRTLSGVNLPILKNSTICLGVGGSGKTEAEAVNFAKSFSGSVLLTGPAESQVNHLHEVISDGEPISAQQLLINIVGEDVYNTISTEEKSSSNNYTYFTKVKGLDDNYAVTLKDNVPIKDEEGNGPEAIIFDEATHLSSAKLQILSQYAQKNNIQILFMGDDLQNGFSGAGYSTDYETLLAWRTPKLAISLRDSNIQKIQNLGQVTPVLYKALLSDSNNKAEVLKEVHEAIKHIQFHSYVDGTVNGEVITSKLSQDHINNIKANLKAGESVGFVGNETSQAYKDLIKAGLKVVSLSPLEVQGREFPFVVIDKDWKAPEKDNLGETIDFLRDLYTMISRSQQGTIILDNGLSSILGESILDTTPGQVQKLDIANFKKQRLEQLNKLDLKPVSQKESPKPTPPPTKPVIVSPTNLDNEPPVFTEGEKEFLDDDEKAEETPLDFSHPVMTHTNVHLLSVNQTRDGDKVIWENTDDSRRDIGIFLRQGTQLTTEKEKNEAVDMLLILKSYLVYGGVHDNLPATIYKNIIPKDAQIEYFIEVKSQDPNKDHVIGTTMSSDKLAINGKEYLLIAKWKDINGDENTITLGALANPDTWESNIDYIAKGIRSKVDAGKYDPDEAEAYINNLPKLVKQYRERLKQLGTKDQLIPLANKPDFGEQRTEIIKLDQPLRLESLTSSSSPFLSLDSHGIYSPVYGLYEEINGVSTKVKGKSVIFGTSNKLLNPGDLAGIYVSQKTNPEQSQQVRMFVLDNEGVSYESLYGGKDSNWTHLYGFDTTTGSDTSFTYPFELETTGVRMFMSLWNARANIKNFLKALDTYKKETTYKGIKGISDDVITTGVKADASLYTAYCNEAAIDETLDKYNEAQFRDWAKDKSGYEEARLIWDFNDDLADSVAQFRLGYSSKAGAYIRKISGITDGNSLYTTNKTNADNENKQFVESYDKVYGIYINPELITQWDKALDTIFSEVLDKVLSEDSNFKTIKDEFITKRINYKLADGWFKNYGADLYKLEFGLGVGDDLESIQVQLRDRNNDSAGHVVKGLPIILSMIGKNIRTLKDNPELVSNWMDRRKELLATNSNLKSGRGIIKFDGVDEDINWIAIANAFDGGLKYEDRTRSLDPSTLSIGERVVSFEEHRPDGTSETISVVEDFRFEDMMNFLFHGLLWTGEENNFMTKKPRSSDAHFKDGFLVDPIYSKRGNGISQGYFTPVTTSHKFFSIDAMVGFPRAFISIDDLKPSTKSSKKKTEIPNSSTENPIVQNAKTQLTTLFGNITIAADASMDDINSWVQNKIGKLRNALFVNGSSSDLIKKIQNFIFDISIDPNTGNVSYTRLIDTKDFAGKEIKDVSWSSGQLKVTLANNEGISLMPDASKTKVKIITKTLPEGNQIDASVQKSEELTVGTVLTELSNIAEQGLSSLKIFPIAIQDNFDEETETYLVNDLKPVPFKKLWSDFITIKGLHPENKIDISKGESEIRKISQRIRSQFAEFVEDNYLIGNVNGENFVYNEDAFDKVKQDMRDTQLQCAIVKL